jgi:hypothetical protein
MACIIHADNLLLKGKKKRLPLSGNLFVNYLKYNFRKSDGFLKGNPRYLMC